MSGGVLLLVEDFFLYVLCVPRLWCRQECILFYALVIVRPTRTTSISTYIKLDINPSPTKKAFIYYHDDDDCNYSDFVR